MTWKEAVGAFEWSGEVVGRRDDGEAAIFEQGDDVVASLMFFQCELWVWVDPVRCIIRNGGESKDMTTKPYDWGLIGHWRKDQLLLQQSFLPQRIASRLVKKVALFVDQRRSLIVIYQTETRLPVYIYSFFFADHSIHELVPDLVFPVDIFSTSRYSRLKWTNWVNEESEDENIAVRRI